MYSWVETVHVHRHIKTKLFLCVLATCSYILDHWRQTLCKPLSRVKIFRNSNFSVYIWMGRNKDFWKLWYRYPGLHPNWVLFVAFLANVSSEFVLWYWSSIFVWVMDCIWYSLYLERHKSTLIIQWWKRGPITAANSLLIKIALFRRIQCSRVIFPQLVHSKGAIKPFIFSATKQPICFLFTLAHALLVYLNILVIAPSGVLYGWRLFLKRTSGWRLFWF